MTRIEMIIHNPPFVARDTVWTSTVSSNCDRCNERMGFRPQRSTCDWCMTRIRLKVIEMLAALEPMSTAEIYEAVNEQLHHGASNSAIGNILRAREFVKDSNGKWSLIPTNLV